jgi:hypothetical protein
MGLVVVDQLGVVSAEQRYGKDLLDGVLEAQQPDYLLGDLRGFTSAPSPTRTGNGGERTT